MNYNFPKKINIREDILNYLTNSITDGKVKINEKLYSENFIANKFGVSRSLVHEIYTALDMMGIVKCIHGEGTYLVKSEGINCNSPLGLLLFLQGEDAKSLLEFRYIIELGIVEQVIDNISGNDVEIMLESIQEMEETDDYMIASENDVKIHMTYCNALHNPLVSFVYNLAIVYITFISNNNWESIYADNDTNKKNELIEQHKQIVSALVDKKPEKCIKAITNHLTYIEDKFLNY